MIQMFSGETYSDRYSIYVNDGEEGPFKQISYHRESKQGLEITQSHCVGESGDGAVFKVDKLIYRNNPKGISEILNVHTKPEPGKWAPIRTRRITYHNPEENGLVCEVFEGEFRMKEGKLVGKGVRTQFFKSNGKESKETVTGKFINDVLVQVLL